MSENQKYKVLVVGPANRHIENFVNRIYQDVSAIEVISNKQMDLPSDVQTHFVDFSLKSPKNWFKTPSEIRHRINEFKPDIIHVHQINSVAFYVARANRGTNIPAVYTAWGSDILLNPDQSKILRMIVRYVLKKGTAFTSDSTFMANKMRSLLPSKELDIVVCNFGVDVEPYGDLNKENLIYSNRMHNPLYRIDAVIRAFKKFTEKEDREDWQLIVAGRGSETTKLKELADALNLEDRISFVGFLNPEENKNYYLRSQLFVSVPESDATAMSLLEAMYYGAIPVVCDLPANREWVDDRHTGIIVDSIDSDFISAALELDFEKARTINRQLIEEAATIEISRKKFTSLHRKILNS